jgi:hypothetical protein
VSVYYFPAETGGLQLQITMFDSCRLHAFVWNRAPLHLLVNVTISPFICDCHYIYICVCVSCVCIHMYNIVKGSGHSHTPDWKSEWNLWQRLLYCIDSLDLQQTNECFNHPLQASLIANLSSVPNHYLRDSDRFLCQAFQPWTSFHFTVNCECWIPFWQHSNPMETFLFKAPRGSQEFSSPEGPTALSTASP